VNHPEFYELIRREVQEANKEFSQVEAIKKFLLLDKELDHDDDELTATLKVRRKTIEEKFKDLIESMYRR
jgi:long-chain acyl-CoA synthetase